jgi:alpha-N-arabinofuranosidase
MDESQHYDLAVRKNGEGYEALERLNIGDIKSVVKTIELKDSNNTLLVIRADNLRYSFYIRTKGKEIYLGSAQTKYLSSR